MNLRLIAPYTESHRALAVQFRDTFQDKDIPVEMILLPTNGQGAGDFQTESWRDAVVRKLQLVADRIRDHQGEILVCSDVDIQFFKPIRAIVEDVMKDGTIDMAFQSERSGDDSDYNAGFIVLRCNDRVLSVYEAMCASDFKSQYLIDQDWFNSRLNEFPVRHVRLPGVIWAWSHGVETLSEDVVLHHANCTVGDATVARKIQQLDLVRRKLAHMYMRWDSARNPI